MFGLERRRIEDDIYKRHRSPPRRNGGDKAELGFLLTARGGFRLTGTAGGGFKLKITVFLFFTGGGADGGAEGGAEGGGTNLGGLPRTGGRAGWIGSAEKAGFKRSTDTASDLEPIWRRKNLSRRSRTR